MGAPFRKQHVIDHRYPDYCCVPLKLIVEIDGPTHDPARDASKDHRMNRRGFDVIRFGVQEIDLNLQGVVDTIYDAVQMRLLAKKISEQNKARN
jgi:very-short-patch-repair endonuclease